MKINHCYKEKPGTGFVVESKMRLAELILDLLNGL